MTRKKQEHWPIFDYSMDFLKRMFPTTAADIRLGDYNMLRSQFVQFEDETIRDMVGFVLRNCETFPSFRKMIEICYNYRSVDASDTDGAPPTPVERKALRLLPTEKPGPEI